MSLCPSNMIAAEMNPGKTTFPNLARQTQEWSNDRQKYIDLPNVRDIFKEVDDTIINELIAAGIIDDFGKAKLAEKPDSEGTVLFDTPTRSLLKAEFNRGDSSKHYEGERRYFEVPTSVVAFAHHWKFQRRWYYYAAEGPGIPPQLAEEFHQTWGKQVRVEGHCGCPSPLDYCQGFAVGSYHIDTLEGLKAFVELLATIHKPKEQHATS